MRICLDNFIVADELFAKALRSLGTCLLVNNNLRGKTFSTLESPATFDESFKVISVPFFIPDSNLLSYVLVFYVQNVILSHFVIILHQNKIKS